MWVTIAQNLAQNDDIMTKTIIKWAFFKTGYQEGWIGQHKLGPMGHGYYSAQR